MRRRHLLITTGLAALQPATSLAHGTRAGAVLIDHPYASPSTPSSTHGPAVAPVYLRGVQNNSAAPERIVGAHSDRAAQVRLPQGPIVLPPGQTLRLRHGGPPPFELIDPAPPLREGERFALTLWFERAGAVEVEVWVQSPRAPRP